eukprot:7377372-Prymnesium_polylepis.1
MQRELNALRMDAAPPSQPSKPSQPSSRPLIARLWDAMMSSDEPTEELDGLWSAAMEQQERQGDPRAQIRARRRWYIPSSVRSDGVSISLPSAFVQLPFLPSNGHVYMEPRCSRNPRLPMR